MFNSTKNVTKKNEKRRFWCVSRETGTMQGIKGRPVRSWVGREESGGGGSGVIDKKRRKFQEKRTEERH